jgi:methylated-DNA-protein-cysteine methyltransferase-like protein
VENDSPNSYEQIYALVCQIPAGMVSTYGRIALLAGYPGRARLVGYALHSLSDARASGEVPWWRVINAAGRISSPNAELQRSILESEGVQFDPRGYVDLGRFVWEGDHEGD